MMLGFIGSSTNGAGRNIPSPLLGRQSTNIGKTLLSNNDIEVVLCLVNVSALRNYLQLVPHGLFQSPFNLTNATDSSRVGLRRSSGGAVHDTVLG